MTDYVPKQPIMYLVGFGWVFFDKLQIPSQVVSKCFNKINY